MAEQGRTGQHAEGVTAELGRPGRSADAGRHSSEPGTRTAGVPAPRLPGDDVPGGSDQGAEADLVGEAEARAGAHAAPYMDADGTLHNLRPIGRLTVSGPDVEPRRPGDTEFGSLWFTAKEKAAAEKAAAEAARAAGPVELPTRKRVKRVDGPASEDGAPDHVVIDLTGLLGGMPIADGQGADAPAADQRDDGGQENGADLQAEADWQTEAAPTAGASEALAEHADDTRDGGSPQAATGQGDGGAVWTDDGAVWTDDGAAWTDDGAGRAEGGAGRAEGGPLVAPLPVAAGAAALLEQENDAGEVARRPEDSAVDLQAIRWRLDGGTLREVVDDKEALRELGERLDKPIADDAGRVAKAALLSVRAEVYRLLGELGMAAAASRLALAHAESAQDVQAMVIAQAELAHVLRLRGDFIEADRLFSRAANAAVPDPLRSVVHENAGRCCFDQGRHMEALDHFARAVRLGRPDDNDLAERIGVCLEAVYIHVLRDGWGPYPRRSLDILGVTGRTQPAPAAQPGRGVPDAFDKRGTFEETTAERPVVQRH